MKMYPRSEFPDIKLMPIVRANGSVSRLALKQAFSAMGCPQADPEIAVAVIRSGGTENMAVQIAMLACYYTCEHGSMIEPMERVTHNMLYCARERNARLHPRGKDAEERAARIEGRPSRWGTAEFHRAGAEASRTEHYPCDAH